MNPHSPNNAVRVEIVRDYLAFVGLEPDWNRLANRCMNSVFLRHEWFDAAWQWGKEDAQLHILIVRDQGQMVGIAPLILGQEVRSKVRTRTLRFLTVPDTQLADIICHADDIQRVADCIANQLQQMKNAWDALVLEYVPADSPRLSALRGALTAQSFSSHQESFGTNWLISLSEGWTAYYQTRSRRLKKSNNLISNRLEKIGNITIESLSVTEAGSAILQTIEPISRASWKASTLTTLDQGGPFRFMQKLTEHAARQGWLSVWLLRVDGQPTAYEYQLVYGEQIHGLRSDYDEHIAEGLSPGSYLNFKMLQALFETGNTHYYMGPGNNTYKLRWTEGGMALDRLTVYGSGLRARALKLMEQRLLPLARRAKSAWAAHRAKKEPDVSSEPASSAGSDKTSTEQ